MNNFLSPALSKLILLLCVAVGIGTYAVFFIVLPQLENSVVVEEVSAPAVSGTLIVTSVSKKDGTGGVYELSLAGKQLKKVDDGYFFAPARAVDGKVSVVTADADGVFNLVVTQDLEESDVAIIAPPEPAAYAGRSAWSPDGRYLAYAAIDLPREMSTTTTLENSYIVLMDVETSEQIVVGNGVSPAFMPDGSVVFIGDSGVYRFERTGLELSEPIAVVGYPTPEVTGSTRMSLAVSPNGKMLALADPEAGQLRVYELDEKGIATIERVVNIVANMPVFSGDSTTLAYVTFLRGTDAAEAGKYIAALNISTLESVIVADMNDSEDSMFSIGAW
jgi:Tol biopolymer transport system component